MEDLTKPLNYPKKLFPEKKTLTITLTLTLLSSLNKTWSWPCFLALGNLNSITQFWNNLFNELLCYERTCSISSSHNAFQKYLETKMFKQKQLHLEGKNLFVCINIRYYPHSEINLFVTLNATLPSLLHAQTGCIHYWYKQGHKNTRIFTTAVWPTSPYQTNRNYTGISVLPSYLLFFYPQIQLTNNAITILIAQGKAHIFAHD